MLSRVEHDAIEQAKSILSGLDLDKDHEALPTEVEKSIRDSLEYFTTDHAHEKYLDVLSKKHMTLFIEIFMDQINKKKSKEIGNINVENIFYKSLILADFNDYLEQIKKKAKEQNDNTANTLYENLNKEKNKYIEGTINQSVFLNNCTALINAPANQALKNNRGVFSTILNGLLQLLNKITFGVVPLQTNSETGITLPKSSEIIKKSSEIIKNELKYGLDADVNGMLNVLSNDIDFNENFGNNNLTLGEQLIAHAFISRNSIPTLSLQSILDKKLDVRLDATIITKIAKSFKYFPNDRFNETAEDVTTWLYQELAQYELQQSQPDVAIVLDALSRGQDICNKISIQGQYDINSQEDWVPLTIAEKALISVYKKHQENPQIVQQVYSVLESQGIVQNLNLNFLSQYINFNKCRLNNGLTLGEQLIAQAFISKDSVTALPLQSILAHSGVKLNATSIEKIAESFKDSPNNRFGFTSETVTTWLYQELAQYELQQSQPDVAIVLDALSRGQDICNKISLQGQYDINSQGDWVPLTIAEKALVMAYKKYQEDPQIFQHVYSVLANQNIEINEQMVQKISSVFSNPEPVAQWINNELLTIKKENRLEQFVGENSEDYNAFVHHVTRMSNQRFNLGEILSVNDYEKISVEEKPINRWPKLVKNSKNDEEYVLEKRIKFIAYFDLCETGKINSDFKSKYAGFLPEDEQEFKNEMQQYINNQGQDDYYKFISYITDDDNPQQSISTIFDNSIKDQYGTKYDITEAPTQRWPNMMHFLLQQQRQESVIAEFQKSGNANFDIILNALRQGIDLQVDCGFNNGLNFAEQTIAQACLSNVPFNKFREMYQIIQNAKININIIRIAGTGASTNDQQYAYKWLTNNIGAIKQQQRQESVIAEFQNRGNANFDVILNAFRQGIDLQANCGLNQLNIAEQAIAQACVSNTSFDKFKELYQIIQKANIPIYIDKIAGTWSPMEQHHARNWLNSNIRTIQVQQRQESVTAEFSRYFNADLGIIRMALSEGINLHEPCGLPNNNLTFAEQAIAQAYMSKSYDLLKQVYYALQQEGSRGIDVEKIAKSWGNNMNDQSLVTEWINGGILGIVSDDSNSYGFRY